MSKLFSGKEWSGAAFGSSLFHGSEVEAPSEGTGGRLWQGKAWQGAAFRTRLFRGLEVPSEESGGRLWSGRAWAPGVFRTRLFRGIAIEAPVVEEISGIGGGGGLRSPKRKLAKEQKPKKETTDLELIGAALLEMETDFF